jgi:hypothetical protein
MATGTTSGTMAVRLTIAHPCAAGESGTDGDDAIACTDGVGPQLTRLRADDRERLARLEGAQADPGVTADAPDSVTIRVVY